MNTQAFLVIEGILAAVLLMFLMTARGRQAFTGLFRQMRSMYIEWPLRKITGRNRPDYARIAQLERELRP
jgi:hypothetical protein